jgi:hypothetical protein
MPMPVSSTSTKYIASLRLKFLVAQIIDVTPTLAIGIGRGSRTG